MKRIVIAVLVLLLLCPLIGCGQAANDEEEWQEQWYEQTVNDAEALQEQWYEQVVNGEEASQEQWYEQATSAEDELQGQWKGTLYRSFPVAIRFESGDFSYAIADSIWTSKGSGTYEILDDVIMLTFVQTDLGDGDLTNFVFLEDKEVKLEYQFEDGELTLWHEDEKLRRS